MADFWGNLGQITPTGRSSRVLQSPKNPDRTGLEPIGGPPLAIHGKDEVSGLNPGVDFAFFRLLEHFLAATPAPREQAAGKTERASHPWDAMSTAPAYVRNWRGDILAANQLGYALYSEMYTNPTRPVNTACFVFPRPSCVELLYRLISHRK